MTSRDQIRIAIVDNHNLFRKGLIKLINAINDYKYFILFEANNGKDMIERLDRKALPDIIIMDVDMPGGMDGFETVYWLKNTYPDIAVLVITMFEDEDTIIRMLKLGAKGYLSKDIEIADLAAALRAIVQKGYFYTEFVTGKLIHSVQNENKGDREDGPVSKAEVWHKLTERERAFIILAVSELTYEEVAGKMFVSPKTVEGYRESVFKKLGVKSRVGLTIAAIKYKLAVI